MLRHVRDRASPLRVPPQFFDFLTFGCFISNLRGEIENVQRGDVPGPIRRMPQLTPLREERGRSHGSEKSRSQQEDDRKSNGPVRSDPQRSEVRPPQLAASSQTGSLGEGGRRTTVPDDIRRATPDHAPGMPNTDKRTSWRKSHQSAVMAGRQPPLWRLAALEFMALPALGSRKAEDSWQLGASV
jgi:hypothetical protein